MREVEGLIIRWHLNRDVKEWREASRYLGKEWSRQWEWKMAKACAECMISAFKEQQGTMWPERVWAQGSMKGDEAWEAAYDHDQDWRPHYAGGPCVIWEAGEWHNLTYMSEGIDNIIIINIVSAFYVLGSW